MMEGEKGIMKRRIFLVRLAAMSAGLLALMRGKIAWAKGLPSDPGAVDERRASGPYEGKDSVGKRLTL